MSPAPRAVGVIGGMGPEATVELMRRVIERTRAEDDRDHVHLIVESDPRIPSRIDYLLEGRGADPEPEILRIAASLERSGAEALAMPCNTAHHYADAIRGAVSIPLLDMVQLTAERIAASHAGARVGLLASTAVHRVRVYERALRDEGLEVELTPRQEELMALIRGVKRGATGPEAVEAFADVASELGLRSDVLLIACSELSLISSRIASASIDSLDVLTDAVIDFAGATRR
jgi:aspartate racemase